MCKRLTLSPCVIRLQGEWITPPWPQRVIVSQRWRIAAIIRHFLKFPTEANNQHKAYVHAWAHICIVNSACCRHFCNSSIVIVPIINFLNYFPEAIKKSTWFFSFKCWEGIIHFPPPFLRLGLRVHPVTHFIILLFFFVLCRHLECNLHFKRYLCCPYTFQRFLFPYNKLNSNYCFFSLHNHPSTACLHGNMKLVTLCSCLFYECSPNMTRFTVLYGWSRIYEPSACIWGFKNSGSWEAWEHYSEVFKDYTSILLFLKEALQPRGDRGAEE